jgi:N-acetylglucosamine-6-sulfatase
MRNFLILLALLCAIGSASKKPNIVFILTDDQDWTLAQWETVPSVKALIADQGVTLSNYFPSTPICCPSRSEMLSGRFAHNIRDDHFEDEFLCFLPTTLDCGCMRMNTSQDFHNNNFGVFVQDAGYYTGWFGKYLNYPGIVDWCNVSSQGYQPPGWNSVDMYCNDTYGPSWWNRNGNVYFSNDYTTSHMGNSSIEWLQAVLKEGDTPFFMTIAPHAPHEPYTPAPWYANASVPDIPYPRLPWYNFSAVGHVPFVAAEPAVDPTLDEAAVFAFYERFRALMAVDDIVEAVVALLEETGAIDNTYIFFTSDHGHHLGEFRLTEGKSHPYEFDIRVPFAVRGPGIPKNVTLPILTSNVDLAPTFIELAGGTVPNRMDGTSFAQLLLHPETWYNAETEQPLKTTNWTREALLLEYYTIFPFPKGYKMGVTAINDCQNNTWRALRFISEEYGNMIYIEYTRVEDWWFQDVNFYALYNIDKDPYELDNIYATVPQLHDTLKELMLSSWHCTGNDSSPSNCTRPFPPPSSPTPSIPFHPSSSIHL